MKQWKPENPNLPRTRTLIMMIRTALLALALCFLAAGCNNLDSPNPSADELATPPLLLISIDGFRHDYFELAELPALQQLIQGGLKADSLTHIFPTKTFPTHYATVTGLYAENTGVVANSMWDPKREARFSLGNRDAVMDGYWYDGEPIWNTVERAGKVAATYFWPGSEAQIGGIRPTHWKPYAGETPHEERIDQVLAWLDLPAEQRPDFLTLYFSAVDSAGHAHGPGHPRVIGAMEDVDRALGRLIAGLEERDLFGQMHILVTSDHGMQQIDLDRYVLLDEFLDLGRVNVSDWGPAAQIWTTQGGPDAEEIFAALDGAHEAFARVWLRGDGPPRYRFDNHQRIPDVTVEAELGWMISNKPYFAGMQRGVLNGMHGWDPAWHNMQGIFIAHGPAFPAGVRFPSVRSVDLYSLMAALMKVPPADTDGSLDPFRPLLAGEYEQQPLEQIWDCGDEGMLTRTVPGLTAVHHGERVFALPLVNAESGNRFADADVEFHDQDGVARFRIEEQTFSDCTPARPQPAG